MRNELSEAKVMEQEGIFHWLHENIKGTILKSMTRQEGADKIMVERRRKGRLNEEDESGDSDKREIAKGRKGGGKEGKDMKWKIEILESDLEK